MEALRSTRELHGGGWLFLRVQFERCGQGTGLKDRQDVPKRPPWAGVVREDRGPIESSFFWVICAVLPGPTSESLKFRVPRSNATSCMRGIMIIEIILGNWAQSNISVSCQEIMRGAVKRPISDALLCGLRDVHVKALRHEVFLLYRGSRRVVFNARAGSASHFSTRQLARSHRGLCCKGERRI